MSSIFRNHRVISGLLLITSIFIISCTETASTESGSAPQPEPTAKDIVISELTDPCQCVDAMLMTMTELISIDLESDTVGADFQSLLKIQNKIEYQCIDSMQVSKLDCSKCDNFDKLEDAFQFFNRK
ncbi:MAG: hypothetical protein ACI8Q1_001521 [Parvicella sp.]|jgi:hypothetical protein